MANVAGKLAAVMATKPAMNGTALVGTDILPILNFEEAVDHPHNQARQTFVPRTSPSRASAALFAHELQQPPVAPKYTDEILAGIGLDATAIANLKDSGAVV